MNELAKKIAEFNFIELKNNLLKYLFKTGDEVFDALIMKVFIFSNKIGISSLMEYINSTQCPQMTKYNYNVFGKYATMNTDESWNVVKLYIRNGITKNCAYIVTRYIKYLSKLSSRELKEKLDFSEIRDLYKNYYKFTDICKYESMEDSGYYDNASEFYHLLERVLKKMSKAYLINYNYLEQYYNSIFSGYNINYELEKIEYWLENKEKYDELENNPMRITLPHSHGQFYTKPKLTLNEIELFGDPLLNFCKEYRQLEYCVNNRQYEIWLDKFTQFIYITIIDLQHKGYNDTYLNDLIPYCRIDSNETEKLALELIKEAVDNSKKKLTHLEKDVLFNLLEHLNDQAMDILMSIIEEDPYRDVSLFYQRVSFSFMIGIVEKFYGDFYSINDDYRNRKANKGHAWENIVGYILKEKYQQVQRHPILDNNKIPDYVIMHSNKVEKIIECKLVLNFRELEETIKKYNQYANVLEFYCLENNIDDTILNSEEYKDLMSNVSGDFQYYINNFKDVYDSTENYKETLEFFYQNVKKITQKNLLKEKVTLSFSKEKSQKILYLIDETFTTSELFRGHSNSSMD